MNSNGNQQNSQTCGCDCKMQPHYRQANEEYWYTGNSGEKIGKTAEELYLNDRFPPDACPDEKGILFMNDAIVWCYFNTGDGWSIFIVTNI